jgi:hypothetical protein
LSRLLLKREVRTPMRLEVRKLKKLRSHSRNIEIFGDPRLHKTYGTIKESIRLNGIQEPLIIKEDGTILSGHLRYAAAEDLKLQSVPVRVHEGFKDEFEELLYLVDSNLKRRQLSPRQIAYAIETDVALGGTRAKRGRPRKGEVHKKMQTLDMAARLMGVGEKKGAALRRIFSSDSSIPEELKEAVDRGEMSIAEALRKIEAPMEAAIDVSRRINGVTSQLRYLQKHRLLYLRIGDNLAALGRAEKRLNELRELLERGPDDSH